MLDKVVFLEYCKLPGLIADRFYNIIPNKINESIYEKDFSQLLQTVYIGDLDQKMKLTFQIYDFNNDQKISKEDIRMVLSYIPFEKYASQELSPINRKKRVALQKENLNFTHAVTQNKEGLYENQDGKDKDYIDRVTEQEEIDAFCQKIFSLKQYLTYQDYYNINTKVSSELFYSIMQILYKRLPCSQNFFRLRDMQLQQENQISTKSQQINISHQTIAQPSILKHIASPKHSSFNYSTQSSSIETQILTQSFDNMCLLAPTLNSKSINVQKGKRQQNISHSPVSKNKTNVLRTQNVQADKNILSSPANINQKQIELKIEDEQDFQNFGFQYQENIKIIDGECYLKTNTHKLKMYQVALMNNDIYFFRQKNDNQYSIMHSLANTFIKQIPQEELCEVEQTESKIFYPIKIVLCLNKSRYIYFKTQKEQKNWINYLQKAIGYTNIYDYYQIGKTLGKGQFGEVLLATHKQTKQKVAIKQIKKKNMTNIDIYQQRREIEVLKMCQHPNIIKLIDLFENSDYYYIILEYMEGGDLFDYLQFRNLKIDEVRAKQIVKQIIQAVQYLHSYGIVHRDLKLENIMMTNNSETADPKLVDFGLSKIMGPCEKAYESFGTLGYVAPEVIQKLPYSFSCDVWSIGCISYACLSGTLPFDDYEEKEIARLTVKQELEFDEQGWGKRSTTSMGLINQMLQKNPVNRITLSNCLKHQWFEN